MTATIFSTKDCRYCKTVESFLKARNVKVSVVDVTNDLNKRSELQELTGMSTVPVTHINDEYIVGWNPARFIKALAV